ncbi:MAG: GAF domain-containing protein [bacterium]|nr:GAF domain-containing protein [bacterium]
MKTDIYLSELCEISETLTKSPQPEELLSQILSASLKASGADEGSLMLLDERTKLLKVKVGSGLPQEVYERVSIKLGEGIAGLVAQKGLPMLLGKKDSNLPLSGSKRRIISSLSIPMKVMEKTIGVLNLNITKEDRSFTKKDQSLLSVLATVAAISLEHAGLSSITKRNIEEMVLLNKLGEALGRSFSIEEILDLAMTTIQEVMEVDILSLAFFSENKPRVRLVSQKPIASSIKEGIRSEILSLLSDLTGVDFIEDEMTLSAAIRHPDSKEERGPIKSQFSLPLVAKANIIGVVRINSLSIHKFSEQNIRFLATIAPQIAISLENAKIYVGMQELYAGIIKALSAELETRNPYTMGHSERVTTYSLKIAERMGLSQEEIEMVMYAGLLHDLGKIGISDSVLLKPGNLNDEEWLEIKGHPVKSEGIVKFVSFLAQALPVIKHHHERFDGKGYPNGLQDGNIPLGARIIAVADTYDAITSDRPYRKGKSKEDALTIIKECSGTQFDPTVVAAFLKVVEE